MTRPGLALIAVVGAGALGSWAGGLLARAGNNVLLIGRAGRAHGVKQDELLFQSDGAEQRVPLWTTSDIVHVREAALILFCVKSPDTEAAAEAMAPHLSPDTVILSLQNGVDNPERIARHVANEVIPVLVYAGANIPQPGTVRHTGGRRIVIGRLPKFRGGSRGTISFDTISKIFTHAGLDVAISDDIEADLWTKLLMNCAYNAVSALGRSHYSRMVATPEVNRLMREAADEVARLAKAKGIRLPDDIIETAMKLADTMPQTMSSTAQDIARGRPTEIAHLNGYVVREGEALGVATPVNRTLNALIRLLEQQSMRPS